MFELVERHLGQKYTKPVTKLEKFTQTLDRFVP